MDELLIDTIFEELQTVYRLSREKPDYAYLKTEIVLKYCDTHLKELKEAIKRHHNKRACIAFTMAFQCPKWVQGLRCDSCHEIIVDHILMQVNHNVIKSDLHG